MSGLKDLDLRYTHLAPVLGVRRQLSGSLPALLVLVGIGIGIDGGKKRRDGKQNNV